MEKMLVSDFFSIIKFNNFYVDKQHIRCKMKKKLHTNVYDTKRNPFTICP